MDKLFKKDDIVSNNSGTFARVVAVKDTTVHCTTWCKTILEAKNCKNNGVTFNEYAMKVAGITCARAEKHTKGEKAEIVVPEKKVEAPDEAPEETSDAETEETTDEAPADEVEAKKSSK